MNERPGILIVDRDAVAADALRVALEAQGYAVYGAASLASAIELLEKLQAKAGRCTVGVALFDQDTAGRDLRAMRRLLDDRPGVVPIVTSAFRQVESAIAAIRLGAADYLLKPIESAELIDAVKRAEQRHLLFVERELEQQEIPQPIDAPAIEKDWQPLPLSEAMKAPERRILLAALEANGWNRGETAKQLDINRTTLYKKIRLHRLDEPA